MKKTVLALVAAAAIAGAAYLAFSQNSQMPMQGMDHSAMTSGGLESTSSKGFDDAMDIMMKGMSVAPTGQPDIDFMQGMIPHHQGAIDMANVVKQFGKDPEIGVLAENIIKAQQGEIALMRNWLASADKATLPTVPASIEGNKAAMSVMMDAMMEPYTGDADVDFVKGMIPHHQAAIDMAKVALEHAKDPAVLKLAQDVVTAQEGEITFMRGWLKKRGM